MSYKESQERKHRLKKLEEETRTDFGSGAFYSEKKNRIIKYSYTNKWLKEHCRRIVRRRQKKDLENVNYKGCRYKKFFDYWWELY